MSEETITVRIRDRYEWEPGDDADGPSDDTTDDTTDSQDGFTDGTTDDETTTDSGDGETDARPVDSDGTYDDEEPVYYGDYWTVVVEIINDTGTRVPGTVVVTIDGEMTSSTRMYLYPPEQNDGEYQTATLTDVGPVEKRSDDEMERDVEVGAHLENVG